VDGAKIDSAISLENILQIIPKIFQTLLLHPATKTQKPAAGEIVKKISYLGGSLNPKIMDTQKTDKPKLINNIIEMEKRHTDDLNEISIHLQELGERLDNLCKNLGVEADREDKNEDELREKTNSDPQNHLASFTVLKEGRAEVIEKINFETRLIGQFIQALETAI